MRIFEGKSYDTFSTLKYKWTRRDIRILRFYDTYGGEGDQGSLWGGQKAHPRVEFEVGNRQKR